MAAEAASRKLAEVGRRRRRVTAAPGANGQALGPRAGIGNAGSRCCPGQRQPFVNGQVAGVIRVSVPFRGDSVRTKRLASTCNRQASNACARRTLTQTDERIEPQHEPDETEPHWLSFRFGKDTL
jgi:hypothetical protein